MPFHPTSCVTQISSVMNKMFAVRQTHGWRVSHCYGACRWASRGRSTSRGGEQVHGEVGDREAHLLHSHLL